VPAAILDPRRQRATGALMRSAPRCHREETRHGARMLQRAGARRLKGLAAFFLLSLCVTAGAVTPQFWENFTQDELLKGTLTRVSLTSDGKLMLAPAYDLFYDTGQPYIFSMVRDRVGNLYIGTGHEGKVFRIDPKGTGSLYFQTKELDVF